MSNGVGDNAVVAISVREDGTLFSETSVSTEGIGGNYVSPTDGHPLVPDSLSSQDSIIAAGEVNIPKQRTRASADLDSVLVCNKCRFRYRIHARKEEVWA